MLKCLNVEHWRILPICLRIVCSLIAKSFRKIMKSLRSKKYLIKVKSILRPTNAFWHVDRRFLRPCFNMKWSSEIAMKLILWTSRAMLWKKCSITCRQFHGLLIFFKYWFLVTVEKNRIMGKIRKWPHICWKPLINMSLFVWR